MPHVCEKCLGEEPGLQQFTSVRGDSSKSCDYCHTEDSRKIELNQLIDHILSCLKESYKIVESKKPETIELLSFMQDRFPVENESLFQDVERLIKKEIGKRYLIERKALINSWDDFSDYVKKESRFFFSKRANILTETMEIIKKNDLIQKIKPKETIYRARAFIVSDFQSVSAPRSTNILTVLVCLPSAAW